MEKIRFFHFLLLILFFASFTDFSYISKADTINVYGSPGLIKIPTAKSFSDGQITFSSSRNNENLINSLSFQALPRIYGSFKYSGIGKKNSDYIDSGYSYWDRSFDLRLNLVKESEFIPEVTVGLSDIIGTGIDKSEYVVFSKDLNNKISTTIGVGWGQLGSSNIIGSNGKRVSEDVGLGGRLSYKSFFTGNMGLFYGLRYKPNNNLRIKAEVSSDKANSSWYTKDFTSRYNLGADYLLNDTVSFSYYYSQNNSMGLQMNISINPNTTSTYNFLDEMPQPFYSIPYQDQETRKIYWEKTIETLKEEESIETIAYKDTDDQSIIIVESGEKFSQTLIIGRTLRILSRYLPLTQKKFTVILSYHGMPITQVTLDRRKLGEIIDAPNAEALSFKIASIKSAPTRIIDPVFVNENYPKLNWSSLPYYELALFDPNKPLYWDLGIRLQSGLILKPGVSINGTIDTPIYTNFDEIWRGVKGELPHVRTDNKNYLNQTDPKIRDLLITSLFKINTNLYGRLEIGYFEPQYAGLSSELLYFPHNSFALGGELNFSESRDYQQLFKIKKLQGLSKVNGHISGYWDTGYYNYISQIDFGKYLAGDKGGTFTLTRDFKNGWVVGGFFTLTDASFTEFGEGSFDKGFFLKIPTHSIVPYDTKGLILNETIRPITGDGGSKMQVPNRLYNTLSKYSPKNVINTWPNIWR